MKFTVTEGNKLVVTQEFHWNTMVDYYQNTWRTDLFVSISEENPNNIDCVAYNKVTNFSIKRNSENLLKCLKPFSVVVEWSWSCRKE